MESIEPPTENKEFACTMGVGIYRRRVDRMKHMLCPNDPVGTPDMMADMMAREA